MPRLPRISGERAVRVLERLGFQGRDNAAVMWCCVVAKGCVIPLRKELAIETLRSMLRQAGVAPGEFLDALGMGNV